MNRWADFGNQIDSAFGANAPRAGSPGMGQGNVPFAPGLMSGQRPGMSPEAAQLYGGLRMGQQAQDRTGGMHLGQLGLAPGQVAQGAAPPAAPVAPQQQTMSPQQQAMILDYLMKMMMQRAQAGQKSPISTSGTY